MPAEAWITAALTTLGLLGSAAAFVFTFGSRLARIETKLDLLWEFHLRRGRVEALSTGLLAPKEVHDGE